MTGIKKIALTGRSGCGKSTVAQYLRTRGYRVVDCDRIAHEVLEDCPACVRQLRKVFGEDIVDENGRILRRKLADKAFGMQNGQKKLVAVTHPHIGRRIGAEVERARAEGQRFIFIDGAVIVGQPIQKEMDAILVVCAPEKKMLERMVARDGITEQQARLRLSAQTGEDVLRAAATWVLENDGTREELFAGTDRILKELETTV